VCSSDLEPFFIPYALHILHQKNWQWVLIESVAVLSVGLTLVFWGRFSTRFGNKATMQYTSYWIVGIPLYWMISGNYYYLLVISAVSGATWAGFSLSSQNYILEAVSPPKRARCMAYFSILAGTSAFLGCMLGGWLNTILPEWSEEFPSCFYYLLIVSACFRFLSLAWLLPTFRELRDVQKFSLTNWFYYVAQTRFPVGLRFEIFQGQDGDGEENQEAEHAPEKDAERKS
jgi:MFS family permease